MTDESEKRGQMGHAAVYGEPWHAHSMERAVFVDGNNHPFMDAHEINEPISHELRERVIECVNAFQGIEDPAAYLEEMRSAKDGAYSERNQLVAALSKLFSSCLLRHDEEDEEWDDDWRWIVRIDGPGGQMTWHVHDSEFHLFAHLQPGHPDDYTWDGHTTAEKYQRLEAIESVDLEELREKAELHDRGEAHQRWLDSK